MKGSHKILGMKFNRGMTWNQNMIYTRINSKENLQNYSHSQDGTKSCQEQSIAIQDNTTNPDLQTVRNPSWATTALIHLVNHIKKIATCQNRILRTIVNAPYYVHNNTIQNDWVKPLEEFITKVRGQPLGKAKTSQTQQQAPAEHRQNKTKTTPWVDKLGNPFIDGVWQHFDK